ncbi:MAG: Ubiquinone biosynthesis O-methyltransferase, mitochondrial [Chroococcopsis gigantea SAG 12.99]|jgi:2-polyprenyl-3-methyl-5-hydroxy-6-metoxy-1,4-benzoquinol methylase|nr:methyltransferase domain-containing protein [Chlorogloea purpurea SAG 13.99]MDV2998469.1 Ubiquinone biosynthesis O-methyltransferase, mitochondrial [Chroococcopsis gigantea SAG 12.99]
MPISTNNYEFSYENGEPIHHHSYLLNPILKLIQLGKNLKPEQKLKILDLGCGNGSLTHKIAQQGYEVTGIDDSTSGLLYARQNFSQCKFIQASVYNLPDDNLTGSFDVVVTAEVIEHLLYPRELLRAAKKCLKPGGQLIITTPFNGYWKNLAISLLGKMDQHYTALWDGGHVKFFSVATLSQLLKEEDFTRINFKFGGRFPWLWKSMVCSCFTVDTEDK